MVESAPTSAPDRVLIVDDDGDLREMLARSLRRLGYEVSEAENGEQGLKLAVELLPQVILSDIRMPVMDGHTFQRRLAAQVPEAAVIVMSGHGDMDDVVDALRNGVVDYLRKPWTPSELISAVGRAAEIHRQRRRANQPPSAPGSPVTAAAPTAPEPSPKPAPDPVFAEIVEQSRRGEIALPPFPPILADLRALLSHPNAAATEIAALIDRDPRLSAQMVHLANSVQPAQAGRIKDIRTAIIRMGVRQLLSLVYTVIARNSYPAKTPSLAAVQARIWRYSIARAVAMRGLAELRITRAVAKGGLSAFGGKSAQLEPETVYLAGLLADAGAVLLLWLRGERITAGSPTPSDPGFYVLGVRDQHQPLGAALLSGWELDPVVPLIARTHHHEAPPAPPSDYWSLSVLGTTLADLLCGDDPTSAAPPSPELVDRCGMQLGLSSATAAKIAESLRREFEAVMEGLA